MSLDDSADVSAALRKRLARYETYVALSAGWHWEQDENFRFTEMGVGGAWPAHASPMGTFLGKTRWEKEGLDIEGGWEAHRELLRRHEPFHNVEMRQTSPDGTRVNVMRISGVPVYEEGRFAGYRGVGFDVSAQYDAQAAARELQRTMSGLLSHLPGMAYRCRLEPDWPMEFASEGALALTGHSAQSLVEGQPRYGELIHPDDRKAVAEAVTAGLAEKRQFQLTYRIQTPRSQKWVWEQGQAVYDEDGKAQRLEGFITDITSAKRAQEQVVQLNASLEARVAERTAELEAANHELEAFAYSIAHDLRAPLTTIAGFSRVLEQDGGALGAEQRKHYLRRIAAGAAQMSELTDALLSLASLSRVALETEEVDLSAMAHDALGHLTRADPGRTFEVQIPDRLVAMGDRRLVAQVIANLVGNAWKFSSHKPATWIALGVKSFPGGVSAFYVADRGDGFDMAEAARLFEPFQRLHKLTQFDGTGIGLALVHKIIQRHGGRIWADARPGEGATFYFTLS